MRFEGYWARRVWVTRLCVSIAAFLEPFAPAACAALSVAAAGVYAARRLDAPWPWLPAAVCVPLAVAAAWSWHRARPRFLSSAQVRALLEARLGLESRLTAAADGVVAWPPPLRQPVVAWRPGRLLPWPAGAALLLAAGALLPLPVPEGTARAGSQPPPALAEAQTWLEQAAELQVADPSALAELARQAADLGDRPPAEQYTQAGLEAADALRGQVLSSLDRLASGLADAAAALADAAREPGDPAASAAATAAIEALDSLPVGVGGELAEALRALPRPSANPNACSACASALAASAEGVRGIIGAARGTVHVAQLDRDALAPETPDTGTEGGGHAPLALHATPGDTDPGQIEGLSGDDAQASLGDFVRETASAPPETARGSDATGPAGRAATVGEGADAVWVDRLAPAERDAVRAVFQ